jgi:hypothetical protein
VDHPDRDAAEVEPELRGEVGLERRVVDVAGHRMDGSQSGEIVEGSPHTDVAGMQDQVDTLEYLDDPGWYPRGARGDVRIGEDPDTHRISYN